MVDVLLSWLGQLIPGAPRAELLFFFVGCYAFLLVLWVAALIADRLGDV